MLNSKFEQLPNELLLKIFFNRSISAEDSISLSNVCKRFQNVCHSENKFWKIKFEQRWPSVPKNLVLWNIKSSQVENWKKEVEDSLKIRKKLEKIINNLKYQMYSLEKLPRSILNSINKMINVGNFGDLIALSDIGEITKEAREKEDLTNLFYSRIILYHLNNHILSQEMKIFLQLPPERKTFEKGIYYISKGLEPEAYLNYEYEKVSLKLDKLAHEVQSYLQTINPNHPAISIELFSPEDPLGNSKWSDEETRELFASISYVLLTKHAIRKFKVCKIFLHKRANGHPIFDYYFTAIYIAVNHRLGIPLEPIKYAGMIVFKWKNLRFEYSDIADPHNYLRHFDLHDPFRFQLRFRECYSIENILMDFAYYSFQARERDRDDDDFFLDREFAAGMIFQIHHFPEETRMNVYLDIIKFSVKYEVYLEAVIETCKKLPSFLISERDRCHFLPIIRDFSAHAKVLLTTPEKEPKVIIPKNRKESDDIRFATGMIVTRRLDPQPGVIIGWDKIYNSINDVNYHGFISLSKSEKNQPFYLVLFSDGSTFYSAQENLYFKKSPVPIPSHKVGKYFRRFNGKFYVPNEVLLSEYPEDDETSIESLFIMNEQNFSTNIS